ncbi:MAG: DUF4215 domain-containing protein [Sandaracinaceae bacterium]
MTRASLLFTFLLLAAGLGGCGEGTSGTDAGGLDAGADSGVDPCDGISTCDTAGTSCDGTSLVECAPDGDGCLIETRTECADVEGGFCDGTAEPPECAIDPCEGLENECFIERRTCQGDSLVECAANINGCLVETRTDCAGLADDGFCDGSGEMPICNAPVDPCAGLENACLVEGSSCDEDTVVKCAPNAFGCLVESTTDCTVGRAECVVGGLGAQCAGAPSCPPPEDDRCDAAGTSCDGPELVTCSADAFGCLRETRTLCTSVENGFCDEDGEMCGVAARPLCQGVPQCPEEGRACDGQDLVVCAVDSRGCRVETTTNCPDQGDVCDDAGDMAICAESQCPQANLAIDCTTGSITADTADGTDVFRNYECVTGERPGGNEVGFTFTSETDTRVTFTATPTTATDDNYDLFVLDGGASSRDCDRDTVCLDRGEEPGSIETSTVDVRAGTPLFVFYDAMGIISSFTTEFDLDVVCEPPVCGDGALGAFETCDDGNTEFGDGCGGIFDDPEDGEPCLVEEGFECFGEPSVCNLICSNGRLDSGEACDDGNAIDGDGCSAECETERAFTCDTMVEPSVCTPLCGNGVVDTDNADETCDDANAVAGDGCDSCVVELDAVDPIDLEGEITGRDRTWNDRSEECRQFTTETEYDILPIKNALGYDTVVEATLTHSFSDIPIMFVYRADVFDPADSALGCIAGEDFSFSGGINLNFTLDDGEEVFLIVAEDFSTANVGSYDVTVTVAPDCDDGFLSFNEECDDDNSTAGDGCSPGCTVEPGFFCQSGTCVARSCPDGVIDTDEDEACDDNNSVAADGCTDCATDIASPGSSVIISGSLETTDPDWPRRPFDDFSTHQCGREVSTGGSCCTRNYDAFRLTNQTGATQTLDFSAVYTRGTGTTDIGSMWVMRDGWDPDRAVNYCIRGTDDFSSANSFDDVAIGDGETVVLVVTTNSSGTSQEIGSYSITVSTD